MVEIRYSLEDDRIRSCSIYTDSLNTDRLDRLPGKLKGRKISEELYSLTDNNEERDVISLLLGKE